MDRSCAGAMSRSMRITKRSRYGARWKQSFAAERISSRKNSTVVPANSGTPSVSAIALIATPRPLIRTLWPPAFVPSNDCGCGFLLFAGTTRLLILTHESGELVVIFGDEIDIALVLDRRLRCLQRLIEIGERVLLVLGRHLLVRLDLGDLRLYDRFRADIFLCRGVKA